MKKKLNNLRKKLIKLLGGYAYNSHEALTELVKDHYNTISEDDILKKTDDGLMFEGQKIPDEVVKIISNQADAILRMKAWEIIRNDVKYISNKKMFLSSQSEYDLIAGKLVLYLFNTIEKRLKSVSQGKGNIQL